RVASVGAEAHHLRAVDAHLGVADAAVFAHAAAPVVVDHDALAQRRLLLGDGRAALGHDATRLVAGHVRRLPLLVRSQVAAAHARGTDGDDNFTWARARIRKLAQLHLALAQEHEASHDPTVPLNGLLVFFAAVSS